MFPAGEHALIEQRKLIAMRRERAAPNTSTLRPGSVEVRASAGALSILRDAT
jgi:hypothetical protein